jgi:hypothetical protein
VKILKERFVGIEQVAGTTGFTHLEDVVGERLSQAAATKVAGISAGDFRRS